MTKFEQNSKFTIHIHSKIKWESEFISTDDVWKRSRQVMINGLLIRIPNAEDSVLIECAHAFFEARLIRLCDILQFLELLKHDPIDWNKVATRLINYHYQSAGFIYLMAINKLAKTLYGICPVPEKVFYELERTIPKLEKILAVNHARKKLMGNMEFPPLHISLVSSAILFVLYNYRIGKGKLFWSLGVIMSAIARHIQVKLGLRKL